MLRSFEMLAVLTAATTVCVGAAPAQTASPVRRDGGHWVQEQTGSIAATGALRVSVIGEVVIRGEETDEIRYRVEARVKAEDAAEAERIFRDASVTASARNGATTVSLEDPRCGRCSYQARVELVVPRSTREAVVDTSGGAVEASNLEGRVNADSAGGAIRMTSIGGDVRASTAGGSIDLNGIGGEVRCETAGGSIEVEQARGDAILNTSGGGIRAAGIGGDLRAETSGGGIEIAEVTGRIFAGTSGGSIRIAGAGGQVSADTAGGSIEIAEAPAGVDVETAGGQIRLVDVAGRVYAANAAGNIQATLVGGRPLQDSLLETNAGVIVVYLPDDLAVTVEAVVDFGRGLNRIESEFSDIEVRRVGDDFGPGGVTATGSLNGGGPVLRIRNTSGRVQIRRKP